MNINNYPLKNIRILELTEVWAGPMGNSLMGDLGAEIIKIESYPRAPITRPHDVISARRGLVENELSQERPWDGYASHNMANRNKKGLSIDLKTEMGKKTLFELVKCSDVVIEGYSAGTMENLGISYKTLKQYRPDLIMVSMPGWGVDGPYQKYVTLGSGLDAFTGHWLLRTPPDTEPTETMSIYHTDAIAALNLVISVCMALFHRNIKGTGQSIDLSQAETFIPHLTKYLMEYSMNNKNPTQIGNRHPSRAPQGVYKSKGDNQWIAISIRNDIDWENLCTLYGSNDLLSNSLYKNALERIKYHDEIDEILNNWTVKYDKFELMHLLQKKHIPSAAIMNEREIVYNEHLNSRDYFIKIDHPIAGEHSYPKNIWGFRYIQEPPFKRANIYGEHNEEILNSILGINQEDIANMWNKKIIGNTL
tara:strand:+ start:1366 stop:2628 length:1263 start_codon:yes stop_codon:yes gene_type:complete